MGGRGSSSSRGGGGGMVSKRDTERFDPTVRGGPEIPPELKAALEEHFKLGSETARALYDYLIPLGGLIKDGAFEGTSHYDSDENKVYMNFEEDKENDFGIGSTWFHEYGHAIDYLLGAIGRGTFPRVPLGLGSVSSLRNAVYNDGLNYMRSIAQKNGIDFDNAFDYETGSYDKGLAFAVTESIWKENSSSSNTYAVEDIFSGITRQELSMASHSPEYWRAGMFGREVVAHMFEAQFFPEHAKLMERYFPTGWAMFNELLEDRRKRLGL